MTTKLFLIATTASALLTFNAVHTNLNTRALASVDPTSAVASNPLVPQVYSYHDVLVAHANAIKNESALRANALQLQGMLAQEERNYRLALQQNPRSVSSPYNPISRNIQLIKAELRNLKILRERNIDTAHWRVYFAYSAIQKPAMNGQNSLSPEQHKDASRKLDEILALKEAIALEGSGFYNYPVPQQQYLTTSIYSPPVLDSIAELDPTLQFAGPPAPQVAAQPAAVTTVPISPIDAPTAGREGMIEAVPEESNVIL